MELLPTSDQWHLWPLSSGYPYRTEELESALPDHSSLTRIRQRWGETRFREIVKCTVTACLEAKIATAEVVHIDASPIRANVSWDRLAECHVGKVVTANGSDQETEATRQRRRWRGFVQEGQSHRSGCQHGDVSQQPAA